MLKAKIDVYKKLIQNDKNDKIDKNEQTNECVKIPGGTSWKRKSIFLNN